MAKRYRHRKVMVDPREIVRTDLLLFQQQVICVKPSPNHPAWACWTWPHPWLPEAFHSGGDEPVWEWLQSRPYVPDPSSEGAHGDFSIDGITLGIGCLLRDMEAMQFSEEFHPPQHVAHSQVGFGTVQSTIHQVLDSFSEIVRNHNNTVSDKNCF